MVQKEMKIKECALEEGTVCLCVDLPVVFALVLEVEKVNVQRDSVIVPRCAVYFYMKKALLTRLTRERCTASALLW